MKPTDQLLQRLLNAAAKAAPETASAPPLGLETRVLAHWPRAETDDESDFLFAFFRGALPLTRGIDPRRAAIAAGAVASMVALFVAGLFEYNFGDVEVLRVTLLLSVYPFLPVPVRSGLSAGEGASGPPQRLDPVAS